MADWGSNHSNIHLGRPRWLRRSYVGTCRPTLKRRGPEAQNSRRTIKSQRLEIVESNIHVSEKIQRFVLVVTIASVINMHPIWNKCHTQMKMTVLNFNLHSDSCVTIPPQHPRPTPNPPLTPAAIAIGIARMCVAAGVNDGRKIRGSHRSSSQ